MIYYGIWNIFFFDDPRFKKPVNLFKNINQYGIKDVQYWINIEKIMVNKYTIQELYWIDKYLLTYLKSSQYPHLVMKYWLLNLEIN